MVPKQILPHIHACCLPIATQMYTCMHMRVVVEQTATLAIGGGALFIFFIACTFVACRRCCPDCRSDCYYRFADCCQCCINNCLLCGCCSSCKCPSCTNCCKTCKSSDDDSDIAYNPTHNTYNSYGGIYIGGVYGCLSKLYHAATILTRAIKPNFVS